MTLIAQIPTATGNQILTVLIGGAALLAIALMVKALLPKRREPPIEAEFIAKQEHEKDMTELCRDVESLRGKVDGDVQRLMSKMDEAKTELMLDGRRRSATLFQHIKDTNTEIFNRLNQHDKQIAKLEERTHG